MKILNLKNPLRSVAVSLAFLVASFPVGAADYLDADSLEEAYGMFTTTILKNEIMVKNCGERFPDDRAKFESALASWERSESGIVKITQAFVEEEVLADSEKAKVIDHIKSSLRQNLDAVLNMPAEKSAVDEVFLLYRRSFWIWHI